MEHNTLKFLFTLFTLILLSCKSLNDKQLMPDDKIKTVNENNSDSLANKFYFKDDFYKAKVLYDTLISSNRANEDLFFRRGYCRYMTNDFEGARDDFLKAIKFNGFQKKKACLNLGVIYHFYGNYDTALYYCNQSLKIDSNYLGAKIEKKMILKSINLKSGNQ